MSKKNQSSSIKFAVILTIIAALLIGFFVVIGNNNSSEEVQTVDSKPSIKGQPVIGDKNAAVQIVEFGDYKCPSCKAFEKDIFPKLKADFIDKGDVSFSFINFPLPVHGEGATLAALASEEVWKEDPKNFWAFHEAVFSAQPEGEAEWVTPAKLTELAKKTTKIDTDKLKENLSKKTYQSQLNTDDQMVNELKVNSTPTVFINNKQVQNFYDYDEIKGLIEQELKGKTS
ncbi:DsbA family protein [Bacillus sp. 179-C3.3 HS]|uniref:DsbA family protein n=1 Tax=Bacillus sp. 179-C3.3 HS TaxID=3232162 RepID=UPI00399FC7A7